MRIRVFGADSNPSIDPFLLKKSIAYCQNEVVEGRASYVDPADISHGIKLHPSDEIARKNCTERRGSPESSGQITANEMRLNAEYRGVMREIGLDDQVRALSSQYEHRLDEHIRQGRKGTPRACSVIAAKVKTILSDPALIQV